MLFFEKLSYILMSIILSIVLPVKYVFKGKSTVMRLFIMAVYAGLVCAFILNRKIFFVLVGLFMIGRYVWNYPFFILNRWDLKRETEKMKRERLKREDLRKSSAIEAFDNMELSFEERIELIKNEYK